MAAARAATTRTASVPSRPLAGSETPQGDMI